jgi:hypothetical protein
MWISIASLLVAAGALGWTIYRDRRQSAALARESSERREHDAREEDRRVEELRILRAQLEHVERQHEDQLAARLIAESTGGYSASSAGVVYSIKVRNVGAVVAEDVTVSIAERMQDGTLLGQIARPKDMGALTPDDGWRDAQLEQPRAAGGRVPRLGAIVAYWRDSRGEHRDVVIGRIDIVR